MAKELIMDVSKELFKLDKDCLHFIINSATISKLSSSPTHSSHLKPLSETEITATNLTSDYLGFRVKTTKKENYSVVPTYSVLNPNGNQTFRIVYYNKSEKLTDTIKSKFLFEGIVIPEEQKNEPLKELFQDYIKKEIKVFGNSIKLSSKITLEENLNENTDNKANDVNNKVEDVKEEEKEILRESVISSASNYTIPEGPKSTLELNNSVRLSDLIVNNNSKVELTDKQQLEYLKKEYNQLQEEVDNLKKNEELLHQKIKNERNKKVTVPESELFRMKLPEVKEKPLSRNMLIAILVFSALIGFYLIK